MNTFSSCIYIISIQKFLEEKREAFIHCANRIDLYLIFRTKLLKIKMKKSCVGTDVFIENI
jgi:hypothetical protein